MKIWLLLRIRLVWLFPVLLWILPKEVQHRYHILQLRAMLAFFGHDVSGMSDEEIEQGLARMGQCFAQVGIGTKDAAASVVGVFGAINPRT